MRKKIFVKKALSALLALVILITVLVTENITALALTYNTNANNVKGNAFTNSATLAAAYDKVFSGDIDIYRKKTGKEISMPLGYRMLDYDDMAPKSDYYYVKSKTTGGVYQAYECQAYANAVYNKLFNEWVGSGTTPTFSHSEIVIGKGKNELSFSDFKNAGVRNGAYLRTTTNLSGTYNGDGGHALIILSYNSSSISYLEGNGDGEGLIRIASMSWNEFNTKQLKGRSRYTCHIVQPKQEYYDSLYPSSSSNSADSIISTAKAQIGSYGSDVNKFSTWYYGQQKSVQWCAIFISWCANQVGVLNTVIPKKDNCNSMMSWFKNKNAFYYVSSDYVPQKGDIVFFDTQGNGGANHVEFISQTGYINESGRIKVKCIGGNTSDVNFNGGDFVAEKKRDINSAAAKVIGYANPSYSGEYIISNNPDDYTFPARDLYLTSPVMTGADVGWLQAFLYQMGYDITVDQSYGSKTKDVVAQYQRDNGLSVDGCVGPQMRPYIKTKWEERKHTNCTWDGGVVTKNATHLEEGVITYTCSVCKATKTESIPKITEHTFGGWQKYNEKQHKRICACGDIQYENHTWNSGVVTTQPTCTATGVMTYACTACNATKLEVISSKGHSYGVWQNHSDTQHKKSCACGKEEIKDHRWDGGVVTMPATCSAAGVKTFTCLDCKTTKTEIISQRGHTYGSWQNHDGTQHIRTCNSCNEYVLENHNWNNGIVVTPATFNKEGEKKYECIYCEGVKTESIPMLSATEKSPTFVIGDYQAIAGDEVKVNVSLKNNSGVSSLILKVSFDESLLTLTDIEYNATMGGQTIMPNGYSSPVTLYWINAFDEEKDDVVFATLTFKVNKNAKTDTTSNITVSYEQNDVFNFDEENVMFAVENGSITFIDYLPGDINSDLVVDNRDVVLLMRYIAGWKSLEVNERALDVDADHKTTNKDVLRLARWILG